MESKGTWRREKRQIILLWFEVKKKKEKKEEMSEMGKKKYSGKRKFDKKRGIRIFYERRVDIAPWWSRDEQQAIISENVTLNVGGF